MLVQSKKQSKVNNQLAKMLAKITYRLYSSPSRLENWIKIRIFRNHKKFTRIKKSEGKSRNLAVVAIWPRKGLLNSIVQQVDILLKLNQEIVCVVNKSKLSVEWVKTLEQFPVTILIRENIGRDFGAYQAAISYIRKEFGLSNIDKITFTNDTTVFVKDSIDVIRDTLNLNSDVKSVYLNLQGHLHAQSFFISFSKEVIESETFSKFWKHYYPSNERVHVINKGEKKLSGELLKADFKFDSYVNSQRLENIFSENNDFQYSELRVCFEIEGDASKLRKYHYITTEIRNLQAHRLLMSRNASHLLGLYLFRIKSVPLKIDLVKRGYHTPGDIYEVLATKGYTPEEVSDFQMLIYTLGSWTTLEGIEFLWRRYDFI